MAQDFLEGLFNNGDDGAKLPPGLKPDMIQGFNDLMEGAKLSQKRLHGEIMPLYRAIEGKPYEEQMRFLVARYRKIYGDRTATNAQSLTAEQQLIFVLYQAESYRDEKSLRHMGSHDATGIFTKLDMICFGSKFAPARQNEGMIKPISGFEDNRGPAKKLVNVNDIEAPSPLAPITPALTEAIKMSATKDTQKPAPAVAANPAPAAKPAPEPAAVVPPKPTAAVYVAPPLAKAKPARVAAPAVAEKHEEPAPTAPKPEAKPKRATEPFIDGHYTVLAGDTLSGIARRTTDLMAAAKKMLPEASLSERSYALALVLADTNHLEVNAALKPGTEIKKPEAKAVHKALSAMKQPAGARDALAAVAGIKDALAIRTISDDPAHYTQAGKALLPGIFEDAGITLSAAQKASFTRKADGVIASPLLAAFEKQLGLKVDGAMDGQLFAALRNPELVKVMQSVVAADAAAKVPADTPHRASDSPSPKKR